MNLARNRTRTLFIALAVSVVSIAATAAPANAGLLAKSATDCDQPPVSRPFKPWLDYANYVPAPDGGLESGAEGWTLNRGSVVDGNETHQVGGDDDSKSLAIPAGGSVTTPVMCVGLEHPTLRFFTRASGGLLSLSALQVDVLFVGPAGLELALPIGVALPTKAWQPTLPMLVLANLLPLLPGEHTPVAFRFTARGSASWRVDDVYVDPKMRQ